MDNVVPMTLKQAHIDGVAILDDLVMAHEAATRAVEEALKPYELILGYGGILTDEQQDNYIALLQSQQSVQGSWAGFIAGAIYDNHDVMVEGLDDAELEILIRMGDAARAARKAKTEKTPKHWLEVMKAEIDG